MNFKRTNNNDYSNYEINMRAENLFKTHSGVNTINNTIRKIISANRIKFELQTLCR